MGKITKLLTASLLFVIIGAVIFGIGFASAGFKFGGKYTKEEMLFVEEAGKEIYNVQLTLTNDDVRVAYGEIFSVSYENVYHGEEPYRVLSLSNEGGVLKIDDLYLKRLWFQLGFPNTSVTITVPKGRECNLTLITTNGDYRIFGKEGESFGNLYLENTNGDVALENVSAKNITRDGTNGDISFKGQTRANKIEIRTTNGEAIQEGGSITSTALIIDTSNGDIELDGGIVDSEKVSIETTNGEVEIKLSGAREDYAVSLDTTNGECNIRDGGSGARTLRVNTTNGDIDISFTEG